MDYEKIPVDVLSIVKKYNIELNIIKRNRRIKNEIEETFIFTEVKTPEETITSRFNIKRKKSICYRYKTYNIDQGLFIKILYKDKLSEIIYIYRKDMKKIEVVNLI